MGAALVVVLIGFGALAAGVLIGRYYVPDDRMLKRSARHGRAYMRALVHLIARDHDVVIAELRKVVEENVEDAEPYFALAALFRGRGEHERAIRVHQALAVREAASGRMRLRALYELGLDFRAAGMPRRAARALEDVVVTEPRHEGALRALCGLYEEQGRFAEAAGAWTRLARLRDEPAPRRHHHLLCAAAQRAVASGDLDSAKRLLKEARGDGLETAHFFAAAAELAAARDNPKAARERLRQALSVAPELASYLVPGLVDAERGLLDAAGDRGSRPALPAPRPERAADRDHQAAAPPEATAEGDGASPGATAATAATATDPAARAAAATLAALADETGSPHLAMAAAQTLASVDADGALTGFRLVAERSPEFLPARLAAARLALAGDDRAAVTAELVALAGEGGALAWADGTGWRCGHCGVRSQTFSWRCGGCRRWGAARPEIGRDRALPLPPPPRERRAEPRLSGADPLAGSLLGEGSALPEPTVEHGLTATELSERSVRRSVLGRVGGWISGAWSGMRRKST